jgi:hypothetical protein
MHALFAASVMLAAPGVTWVEVSTPPATGLTLPFAADANALATVAPPLADLAQAEPLPRARVWGAFDTQAVRLHVEVQDPAHVNDREGAALWDGDALQISIDPHGATAPNLSRHADFIDVGALYATFALTPVGPRAWAHLRGAPDAPGPLDVPIRVTRDEPRHVTTYDIALPWTTLRSAPHIRPTLGLAVQVNDSRPKDAEQRRLTWGGGPPGTLRPGLLRDLILGEPDGDLLSVSPTRAEIFGPGAPAEVTVAYKGGEPLAVQVQWAGKVETFPLPPSPRVRRWVVRAQLDALPEVPVPLTVEVVDPHGALRARAIATVTAPSLTFEAARRRILALVAGAREPLLQRHFECLLAQLDTQYSAARSVLPENAQLARSVVRAATELVPALEQQASRWPEFARGERVLLLSFVSPEDGTLQPYTLRLPARWTPETPQPVIVFLHGKGDPRVLSFVANSPNDGRTGLDDAYVLSPWGRGIIGYRGLAERDVFAALEHAGGLVRFDPSRVYLAGFSMGGAGAWSLALHTPDKWTAVSITSGGTWLTALGVGLGGNAKGLPLRIRHGDADGSVAVEEAHWMREELRRNGVDADWQVISGRGHVFDDAEWRDAAAWLLAQRRAPQTSFSYVCDNFVHRGRSGVRLRRDTRVSPFPKITCRVDGGTVHIDSRGTPGLDVDLGPDGLGLADEATLVWNGKRVYRGPPRLVTLGIGAGSR